MSLVGPAREPVSPSARIASLDVLRAVSLLVALFANLVTAFRQSVFEGFLPGRAAGGLERATLFVVAAKGHVLFALLFGVGLAMQHDGKASYALMARRLGALFAIGILHMVFLWDGDVLALYAVTGFLISPLLRLSASRLALLGLALVALQAAPLPYPRSFPSLEAMRLHVALAHHAYTYGSFGDVLAFRLQELPKVARILVWTLPRTAGLFALGAAAFRGGAFSDTKRGARIRAAFVVAIPLGVIAITVVRDVPRVVGAALDIAAPLLLGLGYGALVLVAFAHARVRRILVYLAPLGRTVLTAYLAESVIFGFVFYGYGLGLFGRLGDPATVMLGLSVFALEALLASLWLRRYRFGPVEWVWRSFTYRAWQPWKSAGA